MSKGADEKMIYVDKTEPGTVVTNFKGFDPDGVRFKIYPDTDEIIISRSTDNSIDIYIVTSDQFIKAMLSTDPFFEYLKKIGVMRHQYKKYGG